MRPIDTDLVFFGEPGRHNVRRPYEFRPRWHRTLATIGIKNLRFHDLRHEAVSRLVKAGLGDQEAGRLRLLSPTDCVKDRLAAYFHWKDRQALAQAVLVAEAQPIDMADLRRWAKAEGATEKLIDFEKALGGAQLD